MLRYITGFLLLVSIISCKPKGYSPKPPGYFAIDTPAQHIYRQFDAPGFPYTFEYPTYATITNDTTQYKPGEQHPYWINVNFPSLNGVINVTYVAITAQRNLLSLLTDAEGISGIHHLRAQGSDAKEFTNKYGVAGAIIELTGNTASRYQFYATDSTHHFLRGSLYFDVTPNADSLKPATDFLYKDIKHMMETMKWKN